ncbi:MAG: hypothetical protein H6718_09730 [Polyangiaceae bacterium]|nr:hypothetical protein [Polyangiaceae bacterium]MCB9607403.1 hypothetical protein [Polyangiaceae bacterium]
MRYLGLVGLCALTACSVFPDQLTPRKNASGGTGGSSSGGAAGVAANGGSSGDGGSGSGAVGGSMAGGASGTAGASGASSGGTGGASGGTAGVGGSAGAAGTSGSGGSGGSGGILTCPTLAPNASFELVGAGNHPSGWQVIYEQGSGLIWESTDIDHRSGSRSLLIDTMSVTGGNPYFAGIGTNQISVDTGARLEVTFSARIVAQGGGRPALSFDFFTNDFMYISGTTVVEMPQNSAWVEYGPLTVDQPSNSSRLTLNIDFDPNARFFIDDVCFRVLP